MPSRKIHLPMIYLEEKISCEIVALIYCKRTLALKYMNNNTLTLFLSSCRVSGVMSSLQSGRDAWLKLNRPKRAVKTTEVDIVELQKRISD